MGGGSDLRELWESYFEEAHALFFVVDANDPKRFAEARHELQKLLTDSRLKGVPVLIAANKQDLPAAYSPEKVATELQIAGICSRALRVHGISGLELVGLREAMQWTVNAVLTSDIAGKGPRLLESDALEV
eukprot:g4742.t1